MLRDAAVDIIMARLGQRRDTALRDQIIGEMVLAQENDLEGMPEPYWFYISDVTPVTVTAGNDTAALPAGFLMEVEGWQVYYNDANGGKQFLVRGDEDVLLQAYDGQVGPPKAYEILGTSLRVFPTPDLDYTLYLRFYQRDTSLAGAYGDTATNVENATLRNASDLLIALTGASIAEQYLQSPQMASRFNAQAQVARMRLYSKHVAWMETNKARWMEG